ncbi:universal stress protein [Aciditerrimonas ferrireducens]|uniref:universal stress protein n=1 Tax=Aciditerrimonas ferrireducens TaxID=667306 RepID=UPI002005DE0B|nr:universal stress protein [Aciditerrimonas ferrireducens]MCK4175956.1 universal stress protein [Aciditerrimonas ferrireducens]
MTDPLGPVPASLVAGDRRRPWVVVGVDPSPSAHLALQWAWRYVQALQGTLLACTAVPGTAPSFDERPERLAALEQKAKEELAQATARTRQVLQDALGEAEAAQVVLVVRLGGVADVLVGAAKDADLLVVGTTPRGRLGRALLGTIRPGLLGATRCPVVLVPALDQAT